MAHGRMHALNVSSPVHEHIFALMTRGRSARDRLDSLASGAALDEEPLFAPIIHAAAANAESWGIDEFLSDPGRLARGLTMLQGSVGCDAVFSYCFNPPGTQSQDNDMMTEAGSRHIPLNDPRFAPAIEATRGLVRTLADRSVVGAALYVPSGDIEEEEFSAAVRQLCEAGVRLFVFLPQPFVVGSGAIDTMGAAAEERITSSANIVRFYGGCPIVNGNPSDAWIAGTNAGAAPSVRPAAGMLSSDPAQWTSLQHRFDVLTTTGEVAAGTNIPEIRTAARRVVASLRGLAD